MEIIFLPAATRKPFFDVCVTFTPLRMFDHEAISPQSMMAFQKIVLSFAGLYLGIRVKLL